MHCPRCQHENLPQLEFCEECGTPLGRACSHCGGQLFATAKFCPECGHRVAGGGRSQPRPVSPDAYTPKHLAEKILTSKRALEGERKRVTVLFADLRGSLELLADRDPEEAGKVLDPVLARMMEAVHFYEGTVNQVMGDGIMAHRIATLRSCHFARTGRTPSSSSSDASPVALSYIKACFRRLPMKLPATSVVQLEPIESSVRSRFARPSETPGRFRRRAPTLGEHTDEILAELRYTPDQIAELRAKGVA